jgi:protein tyrosine phosphatase (PTP) superfamily phosphohydrolase (DUF442 family)
VWLIQWAKSRSEKNEFGVPIPNFARVTDTLYRGALPDADGYRSLVEKLNVARVCSIIEHERSEDMQRALGSGIEEWHHIPFSDRDAPAADKVKEWLDFIRTADTSGAIFTHCRGGRHRTGMLIGVYRVVDEGWTKEQAYAEMMRFGWYSALGHQPLLDWFFHEFDPKEFAKHSQ